ncbi:MAG: hypothetical protein A2Z74_07315 [Chloroflexi bacterium RBG_13_46_9]|nr:MAG: hypothetical protein A2Z74_07315 [Chloroflexi bacterium RBG_13_46_9]
MDNDNKEKQLSVDIDRLIAGEKPEEIKHPEGDYDKNIQFAKKMLDSRAEPSPAFKENLRKQLLSKLVEQEMETERRRVRAKGFWETVRNIISRSPAWRTVTATVAVVALVLVVVWQLGVFTGPASPPVLTTSQPPGITAQGPVEVIAKTSKSTYMMGEPIDIVFTFKNTSRESVTLTSYPPEILIAASSLKPYKTMPGGESRLLAAGETVECVTTWDQLDNEGVQVPPGDYDINMLDIELSDDKGTLTLLDSPRITIAAP